MAKLTKPQKIKQIAEEFGVESYIIRKILTKGKINLDDWFSDQVDIEFLKEPWQSAINEELAIPDLRRQQNNAGIVYVMGCDIFAECVYKIGFTHCLEARIASLTEALGSKQWKKEKTPSGVLLNKTAKFGQYFPIFTWDVPNKEKGERELHQLLIDYRIVGELFQITLRELYNMTRFFYPDTFKNYLSEKEFSTKPCELDLPNGWRNRQTIVNKGKLPNRHDDSPK